MNKFNSILSASVATLILSLPQIASANMGAMMGSGNLNLNNSDLVKEAKFKALNNVGAELVRIPIHPSQYWKKSNPAYPTPENLDQIVLDAYKHAIKPIILFSHDGKKAPIGNYRQWYNTGNAFAKRFAPNSPWLLSQGIKNWGIEVYSAKNEPGGTGFPIKGSQSYYKLLEGLADGVHAVNPSLKAIPGGFRSRGDGYNTYLKAIAPLLNEGKLDGIDLHIYRNKWHFTNRNAYDYSAQSAFETAKKTAGITADINYYSTEFNSHGDKLNDEDESKLFLTMLWDQLGVVKDSGEPATEFAMVWSLFNLTASDKRHGMVKDLISWKPAMRTDTMKLVLDLAKGMRITHRDPKGEGKYVLNGKKKKMWVWQNYPGYTNKLGTKFTVTHIPKWATKLEVYGYDGLRKSYSLSGKKFHNVTGLALEETYMFIAK